MTGPASPRAVGDAYDAVADLGCGNGQVTAYLNGLGLDAFGVDVSAGMLGYARRTYPELRFDQGPMTELDVPDGSLGGVVARVVRPPDEGERFRQATLLARRSPVMC